MSRRKGAEGERELARFLCAAGFRATRGAQHRGGPGSPDVLCPSLPGLRFEAKRCERLDLYAALDQARRDAGDRLPVLAHRRNGSRWVAILALKDLLAILRGSDYVASSGQDALRTPQYASGAAIPYCACGCERELPATEYQGQERRYFSPACRARAQRARRREVAS